MRPRVRMGRFQKWMQELRETGICLKPVHGGNVLRRLLRQRWRSPILIPRRIKAR